MTWKVGNHPRTKGEGKCASSLFSVAAALTVGLAASFVTSTASAQSTAQNAKRAQAQAPAANAPTVNDCISLAMQRGFSVNETQPEYRRQKVRNKMLAGQAALIDRSSWNTEASGASVVRYEGEPKIKFRSG
jgi:hypothetical protein